MLEDYYFAKLRTPKVELDGKTLGIIGIGNIGSRVALKALHGFNMKVIAYDPYKTQDQVPEGVELTDDFDRIFKESDFVSLHCPATKETFDFIGEKQLAMMKPTAYLINTARGKIVDEGALYRALKDGVIAGAGVDVLKEEPFNPEHPLFSKFRRKPSPNAGGDIRRKARRALGQATPAYSD